MLPTNVGYRPAPAPARSLEDEFHSGRGRPRRGWGGNYER
jgi:hypothetical protein